MNRREEQYGVVLYNVSRIIQRVLRPGGMCVIKTFITKSPIIARFWGWMCRLFHDVTICKPRTSSTLSGEIFLVGSNKYNTLEEPYMQPGDQLLGMLSAALHHFSLERERALRGTEPEEWLERLPVLEGAPLVGIQRLEAHGVIATGSTVNEAKRGIERILTYSQRLSRNQITFLQAVLRISRSDTWNDLQREHHIFSARGRYSGLLFNQALMTFHLFREEFEILSDVAEAFLRVNLPYYLEPVPGVLPLPALPDRPDDEAPAAVRQREALENLQLITDAMEILR